MTDAGTATIQPTAPAHTPTDTDARARGTVILFPPATAPLEPGTGATSALSVSTPTASAATSLQTPRRLIDTLSRIEMRLLRLAEMASERVFEDGVENVLSRGLSRLVRRYGATAIRGLGGLYATGALSAPVFAESLRWLGELEDEASQESRLYLLAHSLTDPNSSVRDSAVIGLAALEDPRAIPFLRRLVQQELVALLRSRAQKAISELS